MVNDNGPRLIQVSPEQAEQYVRSQYPELREAGRLMLRWIEKHRAPAYLEGLKVEDHIHAG